MTDGAIPPTLLLIVGPPAVGKMAVGHEIARRTGLRLFHNHLTIEPVLRFFDFGTPSFMRLVDDFRRGLFEEVAKSDLPGLIFTFVWAFNRPEEDATVESYSTPFRDRGSRILFVELQASLEERLIRNRTEFRLSEKPSKRNVEDSERRLRELDGRLQLNTNGERDGPDWLRIDNTHLSAEDVAKRVIDHFGLPWLEESFG